MSERLATVPIEFDTNGNPKDRILFDAAQTFCEEQFGKRLNFATMGKVWAVVKVSEVGEGYEVVGASNVALAFDSSMFHVKMADDAPHEVREEARKVRDMLAMRMTAYLQDNAGAGTEVLVHVAPEQQRHWAAYLRMLKAKAANRFIIKV